jgi:hypothetical protein
MRRTKPELAALPPWIAGDLPGSWKGRWSCNAHYGLNIIRRALARPGMGRGCKRTGPRTPGAACCDRLKRCRPAASPGCRRKPDRFNNPRVEHGMLRLAAECGLHVADSRLETVGGKDVLLMRRFDRDHAETGYRTPHGQRPHLAADG